MKTKTTLLITALCGMFASTALFGQVAIFTWTNQNPAHLAGNGDMNVAANYTNSFGANGVPTPMTPTPDVDGNYGDQILFNGITTGPLSVTQSGGTLGGFGGQTYPAGVRIVLTPNQTSPVMIYSVLAVSGGLRVNSFDVQAGSGGLTLGDGSLNCFDVLDGEVNGQITGLTNNSSVPCVVTESVRWREGGAGAHPHIFTGTGDWIVRNHMRSANQSAVIVQKFGPGTMTWIGTNVPNANFPDQLGSPITIGEGTMIWKTSDLVGGSAGNPGIVNNALWKYDAADGGSCTVLGTISGTGTNQMNAGSLTLAGQNTTSGNWLLSGGTLTVGSTENTGVSGPLGLGGPISFSGGTLQYSANNAFDYSDRFSTAAGQAISIDTAGQIVTYATALASSGGTLNKVGNGELILTNTSSYSGLTTVSGGTLTFQGPKTGTGNITVADGATLGVVDTGTQVTPATLILGTSGGADLEFDNITSTTTAPLKPGTIVNNGTTLISINGGTFHIGSIYPLITWTSGSAPAVSLGIVDGAGGTLSTNGNTIQFNCTSVALVWSGANNGSWDIATLNNWTVEGVPTTYADPKQVVFNDSALGQTNVTLTGVLSPESLTVNNLSNSYSLASNSGNNLAGNVRVGKKGPGTLLLSGGANANTGVTTLRGGTVIASTLANGGVASDIGAASSAAANLVLNGGGLQYIGGAATIDRLFTVGTSGGAIDVEGTGPLTLSNPGVVPVSGTLTLNGNTLDTNVLASALVLGGGLNKLGTGTWVLTGTNAHGGGTVVASGVLQVGANGGTGSLGGGNVSIAAGATIDFLRTGTLTVPGAISGNGSVVQDGSGTVILANDNNYNGGTTINAGTLQVGNGGSKGSLYTSGAILNNSILDFNTSGSFSYSGAGLISGTGNVIARGGGVIKVVGNNTYTGWTRIDSGTIFWPREGQDGGLLSSIITNNGILRLLEQNTPGLTYAGPIVGSGRVQIGANNVNAGVITFTGSNAYTGGTFIGDNQLILGDGGTPGSGAIAGNVQFVNNFTVAQDNLRTLTFNRIDDFTFSGNITTNFSTPQANLGIVQQNGAGQLTLTGNNTYGGGTVINAGTVQVGNGGTGGTLGFGPVTHNGTLLIFNRAGNLNVGAVSGVSPVRQTGSGTVTLAGTNTYTGLTTISNGMLVIGSDGSSSTIGDVELDGGSLAPGGYGAAIGTLTVNSFTWNSGIVVASLNRASSPSNSLLTVNFALTYNGGSLRLLNFGPDLAVGDKFTLFSQPIVGGATIPIVSPGFTVQNDLAVDGSVTVTTVATPGSQAVTFSVVGGNLNLNWPAAWTGLFLQAQTHTNTIGLRNDWVTIPGSDLGNSFSAPISLKSNVFYRLAPK